MRDFRTTVQQMQRPSMLIRAARMGLGDYRRERDLRRLGHISLQPEQSVPHLLAAEGRIEQQRLLGEIGYSIAQHIDILIALMAEVRLLPQRPTC